MKRSWIVLLVVALVALYSWSTYNGLVSSNEAVTGQWQQVETQYQRRFDLIPNLVSTVKGAMAQEEKIFGDLAEARSHYAGAATVSDKAAAAGQVESALGRLLVVMENYPQLKSMETVQTLMAQLEGSENRIAVERQRYNEAVQSFNVQIKRIPSKWIAAFAGFSEQKYFEAEAGSEKAPAVDFSK